MKQLRIIIAILSLYTVGARAETSHRTYKANYRIGVGSFSNYLADAFTQKTLAFSDFSLDFFLSGKLAFSIGVDLHFISKVSNIDLWSYRAGLKYFYYGTGTMNFVVKENFSHGLISKYGLYIGSEIRRYNYSVPEIKAATSTSAAELSVEPGNFLQFNLFGGAEYRYTNHVSFQIEGLFTLGAFAETDLRVRPSSMFLLTGVSYNW